MSVFEDIRDACARVAAKARWVRLDEARLAPYARTLNLAELQRPQYDRVHHYWGESEAILAYLVTLDAVNFGSGYFPHLEKRPGLSGYFTVALALKERSLVSHLIGFYSHVDTQAAAAAEQAGFDAVMPRSAFFKHLPELLVRDEPND